VVLLVYPVLPPDGIVAGIGFLMSAVLAFAVYSQINLLVGLSAIFTEHTIGIQRAKNATVDLLGGVLIPLTFYPEWAQSILAWLPFQALAFSPATLYLGQANPLPVLAMQFVWVVVLYIFSRWVWHRATLRLTVQGG
jgi:ABC-2 type transport system permease protein